MTEVQQVSCQGSVLYESLQDTLAHFISHRYESPLNSFQIDYSGQALDMEPAKNHQTDT